VLSLSRPYTRGAQALIDQGLTGKDTYLIQNFKDVNDRQKSSERCRQTRRPRGRARCVAASDLRFL